MPVRRQCARMARCSSAVRVHPVGLLGAFRISKRVRSVTASSSACKSRVQAPARGTKDTVCRCAPMICGCAVKFGQMGVTAATSSPASTRACTANIRAFTPPEVTAMRSGPTLAPPTDGPWRAVMVWAMAWRKLGKPRLWA